MKISTNFSLSEFTSLSTISSLQLLMVRNLCSILETIREICSSRIKIQSGFRTYKDFIKLREEGFNPSPTSDHFFGVPIPIVNDKLIEKYGEFYSLSVGAVDIVTIDIPVQNAFIKLMKYRSQFQVGQMILEKNKSYWIHISNPPNVIYSNLVSKNLLDKQQYLVSLDNGKSFIDAFKWLELQNIKEK